MKKLIILRNPVHLSDLTIDDLYDGADSWKLKAERLVQRRMKKLKLGSL